jgi:hypothetical protein
MHFVLTQDYEGLRDRIIRKEAIQLFFGVLERLFDVSSIKSNPVVVGQGAKHTMADVQR